MDAPSIQWFPGHMAKTRKLITDRLKLVDVVLEITDARVPASSRNPELDKWLNNKPRIILLNKCDNADPNITKQWLDYYKKAGIYAFAADCQSGENVKAFLPIVKECLAELLKRRKEKGIGGRAIRVMVVGIPNVGKSSFINRMANAKRAKVEDRPGVTKREQWVSFNSEVELLDMPGVLWPKFEDPEVGEKLAFTGAVKDEVVDLEALASRLLYRLYKMYPNVISNRYKLGEVDNLNGYDLLTLVGKKRGMLVSGGEVNTERAAIMVMDEYRSGKLGKISFEKPSDLITR